MILDEEVYLEHFGKKGMRWGVINKEKTSGDSSSSRHSKLTKEYIKAVPPPKKLSAKERAKNLAENEKKSWAKLSQSNKKEPGLKERLSTRQTRIKEGKAAALKGLAAKNSTRISELHKEIANLPPGAKSQYKKYTLNIELKSEQQLYEQNTKKAEKTEKSRLTPTQKKLLLGVAIAGAYAVAVKSGAFGRPEPGMPTSAYKFNLAVMQSKMFSWSHGDGEGFVQPSSFLRKEFTISSGHTFHRLATEIEHGFNYATYSVHDEHDVSRYLVNFSKEKHTKTLYDVTFKATQDIKVPNLTTTLEAMQKTLSEYHRTAVSKEESVKVYKALSGGGWNSVIATNFFTQLKKQGYGAIVDEMDAGVIGESPLVMFSQEAVTKKVSKLLTKDDIKLARDSLVELADRKLKVAA